MTKTKKDMPQKRKEDDSLLSKNHAKNIKYRLRVQEEQEAEEEIKDYEQDDSRNPRVY